MKLIKDNKNEIINTDEIINKLLNLCIEYQLEDSHHWIQLIQKQIKFYEIQINHLEKSKPHWFQKKKLKAYYENIELLENKIYNCYKQINNEMELIEKFKNKS